MIDNPVINAVMQKVSSPENPVDPSPEVWAARSFAFLMTLGDIVTNDDKVLWKSEEEKATVVDAVAGLLAMTPTSTLASGTVGLVTALNQLNNQS